MNIEQRCRRSRPTIFNTVSSGYFDPLPVTPRGNTYIFLFTDRFNRCADIVAVEAAEFDGEGTANNIIYRYTLFWGCAQYTLEQRPQDLLNAFARRVSSSRDSETRHQLIPPELQPWGELMNHTMAQMPEMIVK